MANWDKYRSDPRYAFTAFMYKPDSDTRSRLQFTADNFNDVTATMITDAFKIFFATSVWSISLIHVISYTIAWIAKQYENCYGNHVATFQQDS